MLTSDTPFIPVGGEQDQTAEDSNTVGLAPTHDGVSETYFVRQGSAFQITNQKSLEIFDKLPAATYIIRLTRTGFLIDQVGNFQIPKRLYGDVEAKAARILQTYADRSGSTGVLLSGEKGSGKTLLAKHVAELARKSGMPTLVINEPLHGDAFNSLLQSITQPCVIIFDEFEKVYNRDEQQALLTFLDGVFPTKKLFLFTCNDKYSINSNMTNRPGRIYYSLEYKGLTDEFVREYCHDQLQNKEHVEGVCRIAGLFSQFNFDMLQSLVQEMNRYDENPLQAMQFLNAKPEADNTGRFDVQMEIHGKKVDCDPNLWVGHPLHRQDFIISHLISPEEDQDYRFSSSDLKNIDTRGNQYTFAKDGVTITFTKKSYVDASWSGAYGAYF